MKNVPDTKLKYSVSKMFLIENNKIDFSDMEPVFKETVFNIVLNGGTYGLLYWKDKIIGCWNVRYKIKKGKTPVNYIDLSDEEKRLFVTHLLNA